MSSQTCNFRAYCFNSLHPISSIHCRFHTMHFLPSAALSSTFSLMTCNRLGWSMYQRSELCSNQKRTTMRVMKITEMMKSSQICTLLILFIQHLSRTVNYNVFSAFSCTILNLFINDKQHVRFGLCTCVVDSVVAWSRTSGENALYCSFWPIPFETHNDEIVISTLKTKNML